MRRIVLALILLPTALPAAAQTVGVRAGFGSARTVLPDGIVFEPCMPDRDCAGLPTGSARSVTVGADLSVSLAGEGLQVRVGAAYARKGGTASGRDADGDPLNGKLSLGYLQISSLLWLRAPVRPSSRLSVGLLLGPWLAIPLGCRVHRRVARSCSGFESEMPDRGLAVGGGVEFKLLSGSSLGLDAVYHRGLEEVGSLGETTRFVAIQAGFVFPID